MRTTNKAFDWDRFNAQTYNTHNYGKVLPEDVMLGQAAIAALIDLGVPFNSLYKGVDVCNGGGVRGPSYIAPFMHESGSILWADIGQSQLSLAEEMIARGKAHTLHEWGAHQRQMAECHRAWTNATTKACVISRVGKLNVFDLPQNTYDIVTTSFGPESLTSDPQEWARAMYRVFGALKKDGVVLILAMIGSTGYSTSGVRAPAFPITTHDLIHIAKPWLHNIRLSYVHSLGDMRSASDPDTYEGTAMLVGTRK